MAGSSIGESRQRRLTARRALSVAGRAAIAAGFVLSAMLLADRTWDDPRHLAHAALGSTSFYVAGLAEGLRYFIVVAELLGAALLLVPAYTAVAALALAVIAFGSLFGDVFVVGANPIWFAGLFLASSAVVGRRRREIIALWRIQTRWRRACSLRRA